MSRMVHEGDFILSNSMSFGRPYIMKTSGCIHDGWLVLHPKDNQIDNDFMYYLLGSDIVYRQFDRLAAGSTVRNLNTDLVRGVKIPIPPLAEQQQIVAVLDKAFADIAVAIENAQKNLQNVRELFESHLQSIFTAQNSNWTNIRLEDASSITYGYTAKASFEPRGVKFLRITDIQNNNVNWDDVPFCNIDDDDYLKQKLRSNDIVFARTGATTGKSFLVIDPPDSVAASYLIRLRVNAAELLPQFISYFFRTKTYWHAINRGISGSAQGGFNASKLGEMSLSIPPLHEQQRIVVQLDALSNETKRLEALYHQKLERLAELKQSILQKAFAGELTTKPTEANVIPFPQKISGISPTDLHAGILAMAYQQHENTSYQSTFGHVKAEKIGHMVEALAGIDLDRNPIQDAAGPNDYQHLRKVTSRAMKAGYFSFQQDGDRYRVRKLNRFDNLVEKTRAQLGKHTEVIDNIIKLMLPMDTRQAELFATVFAAWNNLLLVGEDISNEAIVCAAREKWHKDKLRIPRERFFNTIEWMREKDIIPQGKGKFVKAAA